MQMLFSKSLCSVCWQELNTFYAITFHSEHIMKCSTFRFSFVAVSDFTFLLIKSNDFSRLSCPRGIPRPTAGNMNEIH